jgi:CubicO group peptidase (beta-lactamase class C family)
MVRSVLGRCRTSVVRVLVGSALLWACAKAPVTPGVAVDRLLARGRSDAAPGAAVMVIQDGAILKRAAYGMADLERGVPIRTDTAFRLASVTKQFTAMAIMMLQEQGRLAYDDPVARFVPELSRFGDGLTIRHLLTHTGGLPDYYDVMVEVSGEARPRTLHALTVLSAWGEPLFAPGERYEYSNAGYDVLASIIERASGQSYKEFVEQRILGPLGMAGSVVVEDRSTPIAHRAYGYRVEGDGFAPDYDDPLKDVLGSDGIYSTVEDLYRWDQALYGERLVSRKTLAEAFRPVRLADGEEVPYGFGWSLESRLGHRCVSHTGSWVGFRSFIGRYLDDRFSVIVLSNLEQTDVEALGDAIAGVYLAGAPDAAE